LVHVLFLNTLMTSGCTSENYINGMLPPIESENSSIELCWLLNYQFTIFSQIGTVSFVINELLY